MDANNKTLEDVIQSELNELEYLEAGGEEKSSAVKDLTELYKLKIEEEKLKQEEKNSLIQKQENFKDRIVKICVAGAELVIPLTVYGILAIKGFKFEETGTFTSQTFKGLLGLFKPKR